MSNVLNSILTNQPIKPVKKQEQNTAFTFSSEGKIKPMKDKGRLLPSKLFGSPVEYAKDLKGDIVSIGKAAKGKANDHELGRINDLAMKIGGLGLAAYLCTKNPQKLGKAMEFVGLGTFFGAMALWPKLAIQAPVRARTGVDIHQKYIDSQGRKKMLFQDPQYVLTDLYSREDLDKMGKKLGVSENLPDRDNFIKQRAQKTALQGNTLWMTTAFATPIISGIACNRLEQPVNTIIEQSSLVHSKSALNSVLNPSESNGIVQRAKSFVSRITQSIEDKSFDRFLQKNAGTKLNKKSAEELARRIGKKAGSETLEKGIADRLLSFAKAPSYDINFVKSALKDQADDAIIATLDGLEGSKVLQDALAAGNMEKVAQTITNAYSRSLPEALDKAAKGETQAKLAEVFKKAQAAAKANGGVNIGDIADDVKKLRASVSGFASGQNKLNKFISSRVGQKANTHIANQWDRVWNTLFKSLKLTDKELLDLANDGDLTKISTKLEKLVKSGRYDKTVARLMKLVGNYESTTGVSTFGQEVASASSTITGRAREAMQAGFGDGAEKLLKNISTEVTEHAANRAAGARSSFYRLIQTLDVFKKAQDGTLATQLKANLRKNSPDLADDAIDAVVSKLVEASKKVMLSAGTTDHIEKLTTQGYKLSTAEYKTVMETLFDSKAATTLTSSLTQSMSGDRAGKLVAGFRQYQDDFMGKVANWGNGMTSDLGRRVVSGSTNSQNGKERANIVASEITEAIKKTANKTYNTNKWFKIFGISLAALTAVTLTATLLIGRKGKMEKQVEEESKKVNG